MIVFVIVTTNAFFVHHAWNEIKNTSRSNILFLAISGLTTSLSWIFYYKAIKEGPISYVASIDKASILVTILLSFVLLKEAITLKIILGAGCILLGLIILTLK